MKNAEISTKNDNRYTQQSECASEQSCEFNGGFQFNFLAAPANKSKFSQFDGIPKSELKIRQTQDVKKPSIMIPTDSQNNNLLRVDNPNGQKQGSFIDIKISNYPSNGEVDSIKWINNEQLEQSKNSSNGLRSSQNLEKSQLRKSGTSPHFNTINEYEEFSIKTNLVKQQKNFKKQKEKEKLAHTNKNNSMSYLNAFVSPKNSKFGASRVINETRITLKDYLFMATTSSKKAAENKRHQLNESKKITKTEPSKDNTASAARNDSSTVSSLIKERFHKEKYHMSNEQMGVVIKESINKQLSVLQERIQSVTQWMSNHQNIDNDDIIQLYNLRRTLQEYNQKFQESIDKLNAPDYNLFAQGICEMSFVEHSESARESEIGELTQI